MNITAEKLQQILEAAIMVAGRPLTIANMQKLFDEGAEPEIHEIKAALTAIEEKYRDNNGIELKEVASGYQFQAKAESSHWLSRLWEERAPRYSRAFLETLALIAYRQPVTRAEIEEIRGVSASSHIIKTLQEREWVRVLGYKDIPGKPALYGTTKAFLDYFNLKSLDELPTLAELKDLASQEAKLQGELDLENAQVTATENTKETLTPDTNLPADTKIIHDDSESLLMSETIIADSIIPVQTQSVAEPDFETATEDNITEKSE